MKTEESSNCSRYVFRMAGVMVMASLALGYWVSINWLLLAAFVGVNMFQFSFTGFCPAQIIFKKIGICGASAQP